MRFLPAIFQRIVLASALIVLLFGAIVSSATAQSSDKTQVVNANQDTERDVAERLSISRLILLEITNSLACQLRGIEPLHHSVDCLGISPQNASAQSATPLYREGGVLIFAENAVNMLYTPPADAVSYFKKQGENFGLGKKAYAQVNCEENPGDPNCTGQGFQSLSQVQNMWQLAVDITYLLLVIAFVIVGIAIMLRVHIDPRTVMSIQNQIPRAIIAILLITFSYAIIGFLIDFMWVGTYFGINAVTARQQNCDPDENGPPEDNLPLSGAATIGILNNPIAFTTDILGDKTGCFSRFDGISGLSLTIGSTFGDIISRSLIAMLQGDEYIECVGLTDGGLSGDNFINCAKAAVFEALKIIFSILAFLFVLFAILIALIRVWITLLKAYIYLILDIIFAPFWILISIFPASPMSFGQWFRNIIAQLAIFPTTAILLVLASVIAQDEMLNTPGLNPFLPPLIGNPNIADNLGALTAFGFILLTPEVSNMVRDALKAPPSKYGQAVSQGAGRGNPMGAVGFVGTLGYQISGAKNVPLINRLPFLQNKPGPGVGGGGGGSHRTQ